MSIRGELPELAAAVLQPGFVGTSAPDWVRRWLGEQRKFLAGAADIMPNSAGGGALVRPGR